MSQLFHPEGKSDSENETSPFSELERKFGFKFSQEINSPYTISLENSPSNSPYTPLENSPFLEDNEQMTTEYTTAGSSRKRKGEKPIKSKEAKKAKLISKEKGKTYTIIYIYYFNSYRVGRIFRESVINYHIINLLLIFFLLRYTRNFFGGSLRSPAISGNNSRKCIKRRLSCSKEHDRQQL